MSKRLSEARRALPPHLSERVRVISNAPDNDHPSSDYSEFVVYWMHHAVRAHENPALDVAVHVSNSMGLPVVVYQGLAGNHRFNSDRHHAFIMEGARDVEQQLEGRGIRYAFHLGSTSGGDTALREISDRAALIIAEDFPAPPFPAWTKALASSTRTPVWCVDACCIVPMQSVGKAFDRAFKFRSATKDGFEERVPQMWTDVEPEISRCKSDLGIDTIDLSTAAIHDLCAACDIDHSVGPVAHTAGGSEAGYGRWNEFVEKGLSQYARLRNDAAVAFPLGVSRLSPYLHHGHVSPFRIAREAQASGVVGASKFLDELLIWRELAHNFCFYADDVESLASLPTWARDSLDEHSNDARPVTYSWETLARGRTGNRLWDAAQRSLLAHGELHNNVRMTWGKALLSWTANPKEALETLIDLNHRYALDGNDPNSYGGLLWCLGLFDRPFQPPKPVFGTVRPRSIERHAERLDLEKYETHVGRPVHPDRPEVAIVGGGISGLTAARTLADNNIDVKVFDRGRSPGGRASTRVYDGRSFDHGAQYFTARDDRFRRYVQSWVQDGIAARGEGHIGVAKAGSIETKNGGTDRVVGVPGMSAIANHLAADVNVSSGVNVKGVDRIDHRWRVVDDQQADLGSYDVVIVAAPPEQAAHLIDNNAKLSQAISEVRMRPCWAVMVAFREPPALEYDGLFVHDSPVGWAARNTSKPGRPGGESWVLHATPDWSEDHRDGDARDVAELLLQAFLDATGIEEVRVESTDAHRWLYSQAYEPLDVGCLWDAAERIGVCGDWCSGSRIEGAFLSGMAMAGRVLSHRSTV